MHRDLINMLPSTIFIFSLMATMVITAFIFYFAARLFFPKLLTENVSSGFGVMGTSFGFLLGFTIALLWQNYSSALKSTLEEAASFNLIINYSFSLPSESQDKIIDGIQNYITVVKDKELPAMRLGVTTNEAWSALNHLYVILRSTTPSNIHEKLAYSDILGQLDNIEARRTARISSADPMLNIGLRLVLIVGATFILFSVAVNQPKNKINHFSSIIIVCALLAFNLGLAFILTYPFSGSAGIKAQALLVDIPARLNLIQKTLKVN